MATLELDKLDNAKIEQEYDALTGLTMTRATRVGIIKDLDASTPSATLVNAFAVGGMPAVGAEFPGQSTWILLRRIVHVPANANGVQARVELIYETVSSPSLVGQSWVYRDTTSMTNEPRSLHEATWEPYLMDFTPTGSTADPIHKAVTLNKIVPIRTFMASGTVQGVNVTPTDAMRNAQGKVNDQYWHGLPKGYWLCTGFESDIQLYRAWSITATFMSRVNRDWTDYAFYVDEHGQVPTEVSDQASDIAAVMATEYQYGWGKSSLNGFMWAGQYEMANFYNAFQIT